MTTLEMISGGHSKFYRVLVADGRVVTHWGRRGTTGQVKVEPGGRVAGDRAVASKERRGYDVVLTETHVSVPDDLFARPAGELAEAVREAGEDAWQQRMATALARLPVLEERGMTSHVVALRALELLAVTRPAARALVDTLRDAPAAVRGARDPADVMTFVCLPAALAQWAREQLGWPHVVEVGPGPAGAEVLTTTAGLWDGSAATIGQALADARLVLGIPA